MASSAHLDLPRLQEAWSIVLASGLSLQSCLQRRQWAMTGPCRHGICEHWRVNRCKRRTRGRRKSHRRSSVRGRSGVPWWAIRLCARRGAGSSFHRVGFTPPQLIAAPEVLQQASLIPHSGGLKRQPASGTTRHSTCRILRLPGANRRSLHGRCKGHREGNRGAAPDRTR